MCEIITLESDEDIEGEDEVIIPERHEVSPVSDPEEDDDVVELIEEEPPFIEEPPVLVKTSKKKISPSKEQRKKEKKSRKEAKQRLLLLEAASKSSRKSKHKSSKSSKVFSRSITPRSERDSSHSPIRRSPPRSGRVSRQDAFNRNLIQTSPEVNSSTFSFTGGEILTIFDKKYQQASSSSMISSEKFWESHESLRESPTILSPVAEQVNSKTDQQQSGSSKRPSSAETSSRFMTKASLKEMSSFQVVTPVPNSSSAGGASTKTMKSVLAEANRRSKPGRKRGRGGSGKRSKSNEWSDRKRDSHQAVIPSPGSSCHSSKSPFSPRSNPSCDYIEHPSGSNRYSDFIDCSEGYKTHGKKKKKKEKKEKGWKSKHKNVIDPLFLSEVENLIQDMVSCQLETKISTTYFPGRSHESLPSIFRKRKILRNKKSSNNDAISSVAVSEQSTKSTKRTRGKRSSIDRSAESQANPGSSKTDLSATNSELSLIHI